MDLIEENKIENQICISSFNPEYYKEIQSLKKEREKEKEKEQDIEYGYLVEIDNYENIKTFTLEDFQEFKIENVFKGTVNIHYSLCTMENIEFLKKNKFGIHVWFSKREKHYKDKIIFENEEAFKELFAKGVDVICTNYPELAIKARKEYMEANSNANANAYAK